MLSRENFTEEYVRQLQKTSKRDPVLLERVIYAFGLLEAIVTVGMPFVFKGGYIEAGLTMSKQTTPSNTSGYDLPYTLHYQKNISCHLSCQSNN